MKVNLKIIIVAVVILVISTVEYYYFDRNIIIALLGNTILYTMAYFINKKYV